MSGDYETLEINQPKISYLKKISENNTEWLDELINKIDEMKNKISEPAYFKNNFQLKKSSINFKTKNQQFFNNYLKKSA